MRQTAKLGDVAHVVAGVGFPKDMQGREEGDIPVFKVGDISTAWTAGERVLRASRNYLTADEALKLGRAVPAGSTVFAKIGEALRLNRRAVLGQPSLVDNNVMALVPRVRTLAPMYLFYFMQTIDLGKLSRATAVPSIRKSDVIEIEMPLPTLVEQARIVAEIEKQFSRLDEAVANLKRVRANLKRYNDAVLTAAVQGQLASKMAVDGDQGDALLSRIRQSREAAWIEHVGGHSNRRYRAPPTANAGIPFAIPNHWAIATVDELTPADRACAYGVLQPGDDTADGVPFIRVGDVHDGVVEIDTLKRIHPSVAAQYPRTQLEGGELLITIVGTIGRTAVVPTTLAGANVARAIGVVPLTAMVNPRWLSLWFESPAVRLRMASAAHEVARKTLNLEDVRRAPVALPPLGEQDRIVQAADQALSLASKTYHELDAALIRAIGLRDAILAAAFSTSPNTTR